MRDKGRGLWSVFAAAVIAVGALWVLYAVWRSPHRSDLATYGAFAVAVVALALGWIAWAWRAKTRKADLGAEGRELDDRADLLAAAVRRQWAQAADERGLVMPEPIPVSWGTPALPLAGPAAAAAGSRRFDPLPGLPPAGESRLAAGQISDLHAVYGGLGSGRLVIAGAAGSGKSGSAVLLILAAFRHRGQVADADRPQVPVPVLFTAHDWDPVSQRIGDWLEEQMRQTYPLFDGKTGAEDAAALVAGGKVALILDGLDEVAEDLRPVALQALSQQAAFRVVVLSRTAEMASAASKHGVLEGAAAIELHTIDPDTAADYLSRVQLDPPPDGWRDLIDRIRSQGSPLAQVLDNPLTLTLVRDTYRAGDDVRELLEFCDTAQRRVSGDRLAGDITGHLLDRVLPAAYAHQPGEGAHPYDLQTALRALTKIAARMNQDRSRDLQWWHLPKWAPAAPRVLVDGLVVGLVSGLTFGLAFGLVVGLGVGLGVGLAGGLAFGLGSGTPRRRGKLRLRRALSRTNLALGLVVGLVVGLISVLVLGIVLGHGLGLVGGLTFGLTFGLAAWLEDVLEDPDSTSSLSPLTSWRTDRRYALMLGLAPGLVLGLVFGLVVGLVVGRAFGLVGMLVGALVLGLAGALVLGLAIGLAFGLGSLTWSSSLASAQLARRWHTPVRLMRFLDDARERGILRTVGPVYQFRHARLQDRLAGQDNRPPWDEPWRTDTSVTDSSGNSSTNVRQADRTHPDDHRSRDDGTATRS